MSHISTISKRIKELAFKEGFSACGIAKAQRLEDDAAKLRRWLDEQMNAGMQYMEDHFEKRIDPAELVPGTKSVVVLLANYFPEKLLNEKDNYVVAKYAYGKDYHKVIRKKLKRLTKQINEELLPIEGRAFVDSAPVLERAWAALAGLGWIGKNSNLISPKLGSFVFIAELFVDVELDYDKPIPDYCGGCTKCISACPTNAIVAPAVIDSRKCISYWTIEHKGRIAPEFKGKFQDRIFGCDICQDVCPWNRRSSPHKIEDFRPGPDLMGMAKKDWQDLTLEKFEETFKGSAVKRAGFEGMMRNIRFVSDD